MTFATVANVAKLTLSCGTEFGLPFADLLPPLTNDEFARLRADIEVRGIVVPILIDKEHNVIDGQHRLRVAQELGWPASKVPLQFHLDEDGQPEAQHKSAALGLNVHRRQLDPETRAKVVAELKKTGLSNRAIASQIGVGETTVRRDLECSGAPNGAPEHQPEDQPEQLEERRSKVQQSRSAGKSIRQIAEEVGVSVGTVHADLKQEPPPPPPPEPVSLCDLHRVATEEETSKKAPDVAATTPAQDNEAEEWLERHQARVRKTTARMKAEEKGELKKAAKKAKKSKAKAKFTDAAPVEKAEDAKAKPKPEPSAPKVHPFHDLPLENGRWKEHKDVITSSLWKLGPRAKRDGLPTDFHGAFVPQVPEQLIRRYTKAGDVVVDLFLGSGTTLVEAVRLGRHFIGVDIRSEVVIEAQRLFDKLPNPHGVEAVLLNGNSSLFLDEVEHWLKMMGKRAGLVVLHPPYWNAIEFGGGSGDLSAAPTLDSFEGKMKRLIEGASQLLDTGRFLSMVIGDIWDEEYIPLASLFAAWDFEKLKLMAMNVKDIQGNERGKGKDGNLWRYRCLEHGTSTFDHEYIVVWKKRP